jgi:hypothetical protein
MTVARIADPPAASATGDPAPSAAGSASLDHLLGRLGIIERRVRLAVERRRAEDPEPDDRFRGLYISDAQVDRLLDPLRPELALAAVDPEAGLELEAVEARAETAELGGADLRLRRLARGFGLDAFDVEVLLVAVAPDLDPRFERLYGYLHDDISRRRASAGLALELCGPAGRSLTVDGAARARLGPHGPLVAGGLLVLEDTDRPILTRALRVPDRVVAFLIGDDAPDAALAPLLVPSTGETVAATAAGRTGPVARVIESGARLIYLRERPGASGLVTAAGAFASLGRSIVALDLRRLPTGDEARPIPLLAAREARLRDAGLVVGPIDELAERDPAALRAYAEAPTTIVLVGSRSWDPAWTRDAAPTLEVNPVDVAERETHWAAALLDDKPADIDAVALTRAFRLAPDQIDRAARAARLRAVAAGRSLEAEDIRHGARSQNAAGLERLARRLEPRAGWGDIVLPPIVLVQLKELTDRARHRDRVIDEWGMGTTATRGRGVTGLFAGDSGTGKTLSAEVIAGDLGLDLYVIDLSTVVDKYIGETEKNLDRIFSEADRVNGVLLFDEADALFGKRSEVKDARDRYANVEIAYLLQRMERFDGVAILTTNLRANLDEAFLRRLDAIVDYPLPEEEDRLRLWRLHVRGGIPLGDDLDLEFLAGRFKLSGGNIRNICIAAAYLAAADDRALGMSDLIRATEREYRKLGRMTHEAEFGSYMPLVAR